MEHYAVSAKKARMCKFLCHMSGISLSFHEADIAMPLTSSFRPISFGAFLHGYPFARREDYELIEAMIAAVNTRQAFAHMARSINDGKPGIAGVVTILEPHFAELRLQARRDQLARTRLHGLTRVAGAMVKAVLEANGGERAGVQKMPRELRQFAETAATFRFRGMHARPA